MNLTIYPSVTGGRLKAIPSKSAAHRLFFCAAFADKETVIYCPDTSSDIDATLECLRGLGATVEKREDYFCVSPIKGFEIDKWYLSWGQGSSSNIILVKPK